MSDTLNSLNDAITQREQPSLFRSAIGSIGMLLAFPLAAKVMMGGMYRVNLAAGRTVARVAESTTLNHFARRLSTEGATYRARSIGRTIHRTTSAVKQLAERSISTSPYTLTHGALSDPGVVKHLEQERFFIKGANRFTGLGQKRGHFAIDPRANQADLRLTSMLSNSRRFTHNPLIRNLMSRNEKLDTMATAILGQNKSVFSPLVSGAARSYSKGDIFKARAYTYMKQSTASLPAFYAIDAMLGRTEGKWYDPRVAAKWATSMVPFDVAFRGMGPMFGMAKRGSGHLFNFNKQGLSDNPNNNMIYKALSFAHNINAKVGVASRAFSTFGSDLKNLRSEFNGPKSFGRYTEGFFESVKNFASNIGSRTERSHSVIESRKTNFYDKVLEGAKHLGNNAGAASARNEIKRTFTKDIATHNPFVLMVNKSIRRSGITNAKDKMIKGSFEQAVDVGGESMRLAKGRGMFEYLGREFDLSYLAPGNALIGAIGFTAAHSPGIVKTMGLDRIKMEQDNKEAYINMGFGHRVKVAHKTNIDQLFNGANEEMYQFFKARAVENQARYLQRKEGYTEPAAFMRANDRVGAEIENARLSRQSGVPLSLDDKNKGYRAMRRAASSYLDRGVISPQKDEEMFMVSGKLFINKKHIDPETGTEAGYRTFKVGMQGKNQLRFNYFDRETIGSWNKGVDAANIKFNTRNNEIFEFGNSKEGEDGSPGFLSRMFMIRPKGNRKGITGTLNRLFNLEIGPKHEKDIFTSVGDTFTRFWDTTNIRTFARKDGALWKAVESNGINLRHGSASKTFNDQVTFAKTIAGMREDADVHLAKQFDENPEVFLDAVTRVGGGSTNSYLRKGITAKEVRELAQRTEATFKTYGREAPYQLRETLAKLHEATDDNLESIFKPGGFSSKYEQASIAGKFNLVMAKHHAVERVYGGHPRAEDIHLEDIRADMDTIISGVTDPREALLLKGISLSSSLSNVNFTTHTGSEIRGTRSLNVALSKMRRAWANAKTDDERAALTTTIQNMNGEMLSALRLQKPGQQDSMYYGDFLTSFTENVERTTSFSKKNLAVHGKTSAEATATLIARNKQDWGKIGSFDKLLTSVSDDDVMDGSMTLTSNQMTSFSAMNSVNNVAHIIGIGFDQHSTPDVSTFMKKLVTKRVLPGFAMYQAFQVADAAIDDSSLFDGTGLGNGLAPFFGGFIAKGHIAAQSLLDVTGVTSAAKYFEDVMPGSINSPLSGAVRGIGAPLGGMALGMKMGGPSGSLIGGAIGASVSLLTAGGPLGMFGAYDITKGREQIIDEYLGNQDVAVKKGRWWEVGTGPMQGEGVSFFTKNWYAQLAASPKDTGVLYGSKLGEVASVMSKHFVEKQNMYSRPYPWSGGLGENIPLIGKTFQIGGGYSDVYKENVEYMMDPFAGQLSTENSFTPVAGSNTGFNLDDDTRNASMMSHNLALNPSSQTTMAMGYGDIQDNMEFAAAAPTDLRIRTRSGFQTLTELAGLRGWATGTLYEGATGQHVPFEEIPVLQSSSEMTSPARAFWDSDMGNVFGLGEFGRRLLQRDPGWTEKVNEISNMMPSWLPDDLRVGDPYSRTKQGESRLPGAGYETLNNVSYDMPGYAELLGKNPQEIFAAYTGQDLPTTEDEKYAHFGKPIAGKYADMLAEQNLNAKRNVQFYNPEYDFTAKADLVIKNETGKVPVTVKMVSQATFNRLGAARVADAAEMNGILWASRSNTGSVVYVAPNGDSKNFSVEFDGRRVSDDLDELRQVQEVVKDDLMNNGLKKRYNMSLGYSQADKLKILANTSPYSDEYFYALGAAKARMSLGLMSDADKEKYFDAISQRDQIIQKYDFHKPKFYNVGTPATVEEMQRQEEIGSKYSPVEKMIGSGWEYMLQLRTPLSAKLMHYETPIDRYERTVVYGKEFKAWETPVSSFVSPVIQNARASSDPLQGAIGFGAAGMVLGGPALGMIGAGAGAINSMVNGGPFLPDVVKKNREAEWLLDQAKFTRAQGLLDQTGDLRYQKEMDQTMTSILRKGGRGKIGDIMRAIPKTEKAYFQKFAEASTLEERQRILDAVPEYMKPMLMAKWDQEGGTYESDMEEVSPSAFTQQIYDEDLRIDDLRLKLYKREGLDAREAGVGYASQTHRMLRTGQLGNTLSVHNYSDPRNNQ